MSLPTQVNIVEVGPRDGLQNEPHFLPTDIKIEFINRLSQMGYQTIEVTSFVSPKWIPQLADHQTVFEKINKHPNVAYPVLVPNEKGLDMAIATGVQEIAIFTAASETFNRKNINCTIKESFIKFAPVIQRALANQIRVRAYVSCVLGCPYEGDISIDKVALIAEELYTMGCYQISLGDTIGTGTPLKTQQLIHAVMQKIPLVALAGHFHDTYGQALTNIYAAMELGLATFDSAIAGLGGCPYAKGASGNVATEDLVYLLNGLNIETGIHLERLLDVSAFICQQLNKAPASKVAQAMLAKR